MNAQTKQPAHFLGVVRVDDRRGNPHGIGGIGIISATADDGSAHEMVTVGVVAHGKGGDATRKANALRMAACWNACLSMSTEDIERVAAGDGFAAPAGWADEARCEKCGIRQSIVGRCTRGGCPTVAAGLAES